MSGWNALFVRRRKERYYHRKILTRAMLIGSLGLAIIGLCLSVLLGELYTLSPSSGWVYPGLPSLPAAPTKLRLTKGKFWDEVEKP
jgi:hypothetical protein